MFWCRLAPSWWPCQSRTSWKYYAKHNCVTLLRRWFLPGRKLVMNKLFPGISIVTFRYFIPGEGLIVWQLNDGVLFVTIAHFHTVPVPFRSGSFCLLLLIDHSGGSGCLRNGSSKHSENLFTALQFYRRVKISTCFGVSMLLNPVISNLQ